MWEVISLRKEDLLIADESWKKVIPKSHAQCIKTLNMIFRSMIFFVCAGVCSGQEKGCIFFSSFGHMRKIRSRTTFLKILKT